MKKPKVTVPQIKTVDVNCADCGEKITQAVKAYSEKHYGKPLCQKCQNNNQKVG